MESAKLLRCSFPRSMEYTHTLSAIAHLLASAAAMVAFVLLFGASVLGWFGFVRPSSPLDRKQMGSSTRRCHLRFQWSNYKLVDVVEPGSNMELGPVGGALDARRLPKGAAEAVLGDIGGSAANVGGRARDHIDDVARCFRYCLSRVVDWKS